MNRKSRLPTGICIDTGYAGMEMFLGSLESRIMEILWEVYPNKRTCKSVVRSINHERSLSTVSTTMSRLTKRGMLRREVNGRGNIAHEFVAVCSREEFIELAMRRTIESFKNYFPEEISKFVIQELYIAKY